MSFATQKPKPTSLLSGLLFSLSGEILYSPVLEEVARGQKGSLNCGVSSQRPDSFGEEINQNLKTCPEAFWKEQDQEGSHDASGLAWDFSAVGKGLNQSSGHSSVVAKRPNHVSGACWKTMPAGTSYCLEKNL